LYYLFKDNWKKPCAQTVKRGISGYYQKKTVTIA